MLQAIYWYYQYQYRNITGNILLDNPHFGETQNLFWDLPKFKKNGNFFRSSFQESKIVPSHKIWVQTHILESSNRIQRLEIMDWEKLSLPSKFSKKF